MKIHNVAQGSVEWSLLRAGIPTASEFDNLITPEGKPRTGEMRQTYLAKKLAEWWYGGPLADLNVFDVEQGRILEEEALPWFELETGHKVERVGFISDDDVSFGCSPDGWMKTFGVEIKCPKPETHIKYLLNGELPKDYIAQVQGSMLVTGATDWCFVSYRRRMPQLLLCIPRDYKFSDALIEVLRKFMADFQEAKDNLIYHNGGIEPKRYTPKPAEPTAEPSFDVIP